MFEKVHEKNHILKFRVVKTDWNYMPSVFHLITINSILALISFYPEMLKRDHIKYISDTNACLKDQLTSS